MGAVVLNRAENIILKRNIAEFEPQEQKLQEAIFTSFQQDPNPSIYSVIHETSYKYEKPIKKSTHLLRLQPLHDLSQSVLSYNLTSTAGDNFYSFTGVFGNHATILEILKPYDRLSIKATSIVALSEPKISEKKTPEKVGIPLIWMPWDRIMMQAYLVPVELPESELLELSDYAMSFVERNERNIGAVLDDINTTIFKEYKYTPKSTTLATTPYEVFVDKKGVCQDFANLFICLARLLNVPARYRVGYLYTGGIYDLRMADQSHAWVEVYLPGIGWIGFDPTNGCLAGKGHIRVAGGRHYRDATPTSGVLYADDDDIKEILHSSVKVVKLNTDKS